MSFKNKINLKMKLIRKSAMLLVLCTVIVLSSCHRSGCPNQITDTQQNELIKDDNC